MLFLSPSAGLPTTSDRVWSINPFIFTDSDEVDGWGIALRTDKYRTFEEDWPIYFVSGWSFAYRDLATAQFEVAYRPGLAVILKDKWLLTTRFFSGAIGYDTEAEGVILDFGTGGEVSFAYMF